MKENIHPKYEFVVFRDFGADVMYLTRSTKTSDQTIKYHDGKDYPVIDVEISASSHPFFTGKERMIDTAGRIEKFQRKYAKQGK